MHEIHSQFLSLVRLISLFGMLRHHAFLTQDDVRGAFLVSRPKEKPQNTNPSSKPIVEDPGLKSRPKTQRLLSGQRQAAHQSPADRNDTGQTTPTKNTKPAPINQSRIGLGLTFFMRDSMATPYERIRVAFSRKVMEFVCSWRQIPTGIFTSSIQPTMAQQ